MRVAESMSDLNSRALRVGEMGETLQDSIHAQELRQPGRAGGATERTSSWAGCSRSDPQLRTGFSIVASKRGFDGIGAEVVRQQQTRFEIL